MGFYLNAVCDNFGPAPKQCLGAGTDQHMTGIAFDNDRETFADVLAMLAGSGWAVGAVREGAAHALERELLCPSCAAVPDPKTPVSVPDPKTPVSVDIGEQTIVARQGEKVVFKAIRQGAHFSSTTGAEYPTASGPVTVAGGFVFLPFQCAGELNLVLLRRVPDPNEEQ